MLLLFCTVFTFIASGCTLYASASNTVACNYVDKNSYIRAGYCNYTIIPGSDKESTIIRIYNSYEFRNQNDIKTILYQIITSEAGIKCNLSVNDIPHYTAEWLTHNFAYYNPNVAASMLNVPVEKIINSSEHSDLNLNDKYADIYMMYYNAFYQ